MPGGGVRIRIGVRGFATPVPLRQGVPRRASVPRAPFVCRVYGCRLTFEECGFLGLPVQLRGQSDPEEVATPNPEVLGTEPGGPIPQFRSRSVGDRPPKERIDDNQPSETLSTLEVFRYKDLSIRSLC